MLLLSLGYAGLQGFYVAVLGLLILNERGRLAFLDEGHHSRRDPSPSHPKLLARISHRLAGAIQLGWLICGTVPATEPSLNLFYDAILGGLGILVTWTAAGDFPHQHVRNRDGVSGTLSSRAIVTHDEMVEHLFYQILNLLQALYLHAIPRLHAPWQRFAALAAVTAPWLVRGRFPVHPFSQNWSPTVDGSLTECGSESNYTSRSRFTQGALETVLYRIKKWQYLLYKHLLLHGVNLLACLQPSSSSAAAAVTEVGSIVHDPSWRLYWACLNSSYVMEFFLQSLVKRKALTQPTMLLLNRWLMLVSTLAASLVLRQLFCAPFLALSLASLVGNLVHRKHDFLHVAVLALVATSYVST